MTLEQASEEAYKLTEKDVALSNKKVIKEYKKVLDETNVKVAKVYNDYLSNINPDDYLFELTKGNRLRRLKRQVNNIIAKSMKKIDKLLIESSELAFTNNYYRQQYLANFFTKNKAINKVSKSKMKASVLGIADGISDRQFLPKYGKLTDILIKNNQLTGKGISNIIQNGISQGLTPKQMETKIIKQMNVSVNNAIRISRTEANRNMNAGAYANSLELQQTGEDFKRQIVSIIDSVTREQSIEVNGQIEDSNGFFTYPGGVLVKVPGNSGVSKWDVNDREVVVLVPVGKDKTIEVGTNPTTGKNTKISFRNFKSWLKGK